MRDASASSLNSWAFVASALLLLWPSSAFAFRTAADTDRFAGSGRVRWSAAEFRYFVHSSHAPSVGVDGPSVRDAAQRALATWAAPDCDSLEGLFGGFDPLPASPNDGHVTLDVIEDSDLWRAYGLFPDQAAVTDVRYEQQENGQWLIVDADIRINAGDQEWGPGGRDLQAVLTHELGHALGLLHPCEIDGTVPSCGDPQPTAVMVPDYLGLSQRELDEDDVAGICYLYPDVPPPPESASGGRELGDPCDANAQCATGFCGEESVCVAPCTELSCGGDAVCNTGALIPECDPSGGPFGAWCDQGNDCTSRACYVRGGLGVCTRACGSECPSGFTCSDAAGAYVCTPNRPAPGCNVGRGQGAGGAPWCLGLVAIVCVLQRGRRGVQS